MCMFDDLVVSATAVMCDIGAWLKHNAPDDDQKMLPDGDDAYRDTQPDNADLIGRNLNQWSSDTQYFTRRGPQHVLFA